MICGNIYKEWALIVFMGLVLVFLGMRAKGLNFESFYEESGVGYIVKGEVGNVRSGPSKDYEIVGQVQSGVPVYLTGDREDAWLEVEAKKNGLKGYMYRGILKRVLVNGYKRRFGSEDFFLSF